MAASARRKLKKQSRLQLFPLPSSSPSKNEYSQTVHDRLANVRFGNKKGRPKLKPAATPMPTPASSSQINSDQRPEVEAYPSLQSDDEDVLSPASKRRRVSTIRPSYTTLTPPQSSRRKLSSGSTSQARPSDATSSSPSQQLHSVEISSRTTRSRAAANAVPSPPQQALSRWRRNRLSDLGSPETSGEEQDVLVTKPTLRRRQRRREALAGNDGLVVLDHDGGVTTSDDDDNIASFTPSKKPKPKASEQTPRSRRLKTRRERQELEEDLEGLRDSVSPQLQSSRTREAPVNKERERRRAHLELLKRRRAGEKEPIQLDSTDDEAGKGSANMFTDYFDRTVDTIGDGLSSEDDKVTPNSELDVNEEDFVVSDEEDEQDRQADSRSRGRLDPDIPIEFTSYASSPPRELFIFVIEWLVKNRIAPAFPRHDQLWKLAFSKVEAEMTGQVGSRLQSSVWTGPFRTALNARPVLKVSKLNVNDTVLPNGCDACNRKNHPAQYDFVFSGSAYDHDTLEPVDDQDSTPSEDAEEGEGEGKGEGEGEDEKTPSIDSQGHPIPPPATHFLLGRHCAHNANLAHRLTHWKFTLNERIMVHLESEGVLSAEAIVRREGVSQGRRKKKKNNNSKKRREKEAEDLVDRMQAAGVVDDLWHGFRDDLRDARVGMEGAAVGWKAGRRGGNQKMKIGSVRVVAPAADDDE